MEKETLSLLADVALARLSVDSRGVRCRSALASIPACLALLAEPGCARPGDDAAPGVAASASAGAPGSSWSREAMAPRGGAAEPVDPAVMGSIDPGALGDLLAAAPKPGASAAASAGPMIGANTGVAASSASAIEPAPPEPTHAPRVTVGVPTLQASIATPAIERAARAQLYWNLVQRCRDKGGKILPPDAISLSFSIDADGYITPSSIVARAVSPEHADAAHCMRRELSTATFRAPSATWGHAGEVRATLPSVD